MGYDLHIARREHWADTETTDITLDEWLAYVNSDKELELRNGYNIKIGSESQFQDVPGFCEWNAHPNEREQNSRPWFSYWNGSIETKNPDTSTIRKMIQIATALNAKVQGDDGEFYTDENLVELGVAEEQKQQYSKPQNKMPWWKFW